MFCRETDCVAARNVYHMTMYLVPVICDLSPKDAEPTAFRVILHLATSDRSRNVTAVNGVIIEGTGWRQSFRTIIDGP